MKRNFVTYCFLIFQAAFLNAQDIHFTQFQSSPLYLNPSFTGANVDSRVSMIYRNQWWAIPGTYNSFLASYDYYFPNFKSGIGAFIASDNAGSMNFGNRFLGISYAYDYKLDRDWSVSMGLKFSYGYRTLSFDKLVFGDQLLRGASTSLQPVLPERSSYVDLSYGALFYSADQYIGLSINNLNRPNQSFNDLDGKLPVRYSFHGAKTFYTDGGGGSGRKTDKPVIIGLLQYQFQKDFDEADIGAIYKFPHYFFGLYYRGLPLLKSYKKGYPNNDALCMLAGIKFKTLEFAYSYDLTVSWLTYKTGGSNEISLIYTFSNPHKSAKSHAKIIPCAKF
jgi:type IX secretion system PorP/SprF family membrane protein